MMFWDVCNQFLKEKVSCVNTEIETLLFYVGDLFQMPCFYEIIKPTLNKMIFENYERWISLLKTGRFGSVNTSNR